MALGSGFVYFLLVDTGSAKIDLNLQIKADLSKIIFFIQAFFNRLNTDPHFEIEKPNTCKVEGR